MYAPDPSQCITPTGLENCRSETIADTMGRCEDASKSSSNDGNLWWADVCPRRRRASREEPMHGLLNVLAVEKERRRVTAPRVVSDTIMIRLPQGQSRAMIERGAKQVEGARDIASSLRRQGTLGEPWISHVNGMCRQQHESPRGFPCLPSQFTIIPDPWPRMFSIQVRKTIFAHTISVFVICGGTCRSGAACYTFTYVSSPSLTHLLHSHSEGCNGGSMYVKYGNVHVGLIGDERAESTCQAHVSP